MKMKLKITIKIVRLIIIKNMKNKIIIFVLQMDYVKQKLNNSESVLIILLIIYI